jgi:hypothetical protein
VIDMRASRGPQRAEDRHADASCRVVGCGHAEGRDSCRKSSPRPGVVRIEAAEGLTPESLPAYRGVLAALRDTDRRLADLRRRRAEAKAEAPEIDRGIAELVRDHRRQMLEHGAAGQLAVAGEVEVLPLDDEAALARARPVGPDGKVRADPSAVEARHDAQVRAALASGPCAFVILGGSHDLSASVRRLGGGATEYLRLTTRRFQEVAAGE